MLKEFQESFSIFRISSKDEKEQKRRNCQLTGYFLRKEAIR
jgi:hypothetical protein